MKTNEKFIALDAVISSTGMTEEEFNSYVQKRQKTTSEIVDLIFPVVYWKNRETGEQETINGLIRGREKDVFGYEIIPAIGDEPAVVIAKKCGCDGNVKNTDWNSCKNFAENVSNNGKKGFLSSKELFQTHWSLELRDKIKAMDTALCGNGVDGEQEYSGICFCSEIFRDNLAYYFDLKNGFYIWNNKNLIFNNDRLAVAF